MFAAGSEYRGPTEGLVLRNTTEDEAIGAEKEVDLILPRTTKRVRITSARDAPAHGNGILDQWQTPAG